MHLLCRVAAMGLHWHHTISRLASPAPLPTMVHLASACGRMDTQQIKWEDPPPGVCSDVLTAFLGHGEPQASGPCRLSPQQPCRKEAEPHSAASPSSPADAGMLWCLSSKRPAPGLTTIQNPPLPPNKSKLSEPCSEGSQHSPLAE